MTGLMVGRKSIPYSEEPHKKMSGSAKARGIKTWLVRVDSVTCDCSGGQTDGTAWTLRVMTYSVFVREWLYFMGTLKLIAPPSSPSLAPSLG